MDDDQSLEIRLELQKRIDKNEAKQHEALREKDYHLASQMGQKIADDLERIIEILDRQAGYDPRSS